jgi:hypothetical protein
VIRILSVEFSALINGPIINANARPIIDVTASFSNNTPIRGKIADRESKIIIIFKLSMNGSKTINCVLKKRIDIINKENTTKFMIR